MHSRAHCCETRARHIIEWMDSYYRIRSHVQSEFELFVLICGRFSFAKLRKETCEKRYLVHEKMKLGTVFLIIRLEKQSDVLHTRKFELKNITTNNSWIRITTWTLDFHFNVIFYQKNEIVDRYLSGHSYHERKETSMHRTLLPIFTHMP